MYALFAPAVLAAAVGLSLCLTDINPFNPEPETRADEMPEWLVELNEDAETWAAWARVPKGWKAVSGRVTPR